MPIWGRHLMLDALVKLDITRVGIGINGAAHGYSEGGMASA